MEPETKNVASELYRNFIKKAEECYSAMNYSYERENWNMAVIAAIHCAISSADALTVKFLGVRHSGMRHEGVVKLMSDLKLDDISAKNRQLLNLLRIKSAAEYEHRLMTKSDASDSIRDAERFYKWARKTLGEE